MWTAHSVPKDRRTLRFRLLLDGRNGISYGETIHAWRDDAHFRAFFTAVLAKAPFGAFRWETPPVTTATVDRPFEFVVLEAPSLAVPADPTAFAGQFAARPDADVVSFANLGGDARLVVPRPEGDRSAYAHLGVFLRQAPEGQRDALWQAVGAAMQQRLSARPVWLSTAGVGVPWLHVRLDDHPKYYAFERYRAE